MNARRNRKKRGVLGWTWRLLVLLVLWLVGVAGYIAWTGQRDDARPADAIIVLGAAAYDAKPSPVFEERIRHGIDLYKRGLAPKIIFTGGMVWCASHAAQAGLPTLAKMRLPSSPG